MGMLAFNMFVFPGGIFAIIYSLILMGLDRKIYARLQRRVGPPIYQPFIDVVKLLRKEILVPKSANFIIFRLAPLLGFVGMLVAAIIIPIPGVYNGLDKSADLIVLLYLLATPALAIMIGAAASGSSYSAVGLSREMMLTIAYEIPLLMVFLAVGMKVGMAGGNFADFSLKNIVSYQQHKGSFICDIMMLPALIAYLCCIPGTIGVVPFDIPEAETEIAEGPILEYSGSGLAMFKLTGGIKVTVITALAVTLFFPFTIGGSWVINLLWFIIKCVVLATISITIVRATRARMRIDQAFKFYLIAPTGLALVSIILILISSKL